MYVPRRDHRFEYLWDAMNHVEETQCRGCVLRKDDNDEYPMCNEVESVFIQEIPVEAIDDRGDEGLFCTLRRTT